MSSINKTRNTATKWRVTMIKIKCNSATEKLMLYLSELNKKDFEWASEMIKEFFKNNVSVGCENLTLERYKIKVVSDNQKE